MTRVCMLRLQFLAMVLRSLSCQAELYTAVSDMESLLETHKSVIDVLEIFIKKDEQKIRTLKTNVVLYKQEYQKAMEDIQNYLRNRSNALALSERLNIDLDAIEDSIKMNTEYVKKKRINYDNMKYPTIEDLMGAAQGLARLQQTYHLNAKDLAEGILNGVEYSTPMTSGDCYEVGRALYNHKDVKNALAWMVEAHRKFRVEDPNETLPFTEVELVEYIGFSHYLLGDLKAGLNWTYKLLELDNSHARALESIPQFQKLIDVEEANEKRRRLRHKGDPEQKITDKVTKDDPWNSNKNKTENYEALCRGEFEIAPDITKRLKCWYSSKHHPFLKYAPFKVEQMYIAPDIFTYHDVLYDAEIELILSMAKPSLLRALVRGSEVTQNRISKTSWLTDDKDPVIARVSQRVTDMTGLDTETAESLQVANYGIGGYYEPHFDFTRRRDKTSEADNRIATVIFYMSEVAQGGATVFTELGLSLFPIKGAAVFWMNLHPSGEGDIATRHGACPVLRGCKWEYLFQVCTKWIHQNGQELIKPGTLEYQEEYFSRELLQPVLKTSRW